jgi:hypothetical protein
MPDQTFAQAMEITHNPVQANGPVMLSLAADNTKFVVEREGIVKFENAVNLPPPDLNPSISAGGRGLRYVVAGELFPQFGKGPHRRLDSGAGFRTAEAQAQVPPDATFSRHLDGGWLPIPVTTYEEGGVVYRQRTFVAPADASFLEDRQGMVPSVCVVEFTVENTQPVDAEARLALSFLQSIRGEVAAKIEAAEGGYRVLREAGAMAWIDARDGEALEAGVADGTIAFAGQLGPGARERVVVFLPGEQLDAEALQAFNDPEALRDRVEEYWREVLSSGMNVEIPDPFLQNVFESSRVRCLINARSEAEGSRIAPWIAALRYGPLESEAHAIIRAMDLLGHSDYARKSLDYYIHRYNDADFLTTGYTTFGTGWHLWTLGEHFELNRDEEWLRSVAPEVSRVGHWVIRQLDKTRKLAADGNSVPEHGLMPPGVLADWHSFAYHFMMNAYYYAGLRDVAAALKAIDHPDSGEFAARATEFRDDILRAYRWTQSQTPVVPLRDGSWVLPYPSRVHSPGKLEDFFPGEDSGRSWCYDVELGAHQLVPTGVLPAESEEVAEMMNHMEDVQFLGSGWFDYPAERNKADWFNLGGFSKVQPYYARNAEIYAMRDDVRPFLRSYFNALASLLNPEVLTLWEHFHTRAAWDKTHETAYFLMQTRHMLVNEREETLWLAPFVPQEWMRDGRVITVAAAPTRFGEVGYQIRSHAADGYIEAVIEPPSRNSLKAMVLRLRHPEGKQIQAVAVNGSSSTEFDADEGTILLNPGPEGRLIVRADY